ncbi:MAG: MBL fold metallo-hydrolase [Proteobacteria bacterium]|nr:MBL fold metallo-hydrolase [Cystobacterineae bacterium]MCL2259116.1 MBL fold metallo-hydrolase [Cystobacterineae bacterium]MCL2314500.1 MBL fold metallo-hydrolase [Pseudomonadota bacterium]
MQTPNAELYIRQLAVGPMANFVYLLGAADSDEAILVDASWEAERILQSAEQDNKRLTAIALTHAHYDHVQALPELVERLNIPVFLQQAEMEFIRACPPSFCPNVCALLEASPSSFRPLQADTLVSLAGLKIHMLLTPGHTAGGQCLFVENALFTGDVLFVGACGRTDLPGGNAQQLYESLCLKLKTLPEETRVFPGHDYGDTPVSSLQRERQHNPCMQNKKSFFSSRA